MNWIFLQGLMRERRHWGDFLEEFKKDPSVQKVLCLDLPGVGTEKDRFYIPSIPQVVKDLRTRFLHFNGGESKVAKWGILGISLGGMLALQWAKDFPEDIDKIILINSSSRESTLIKRLKFESVRHMIAILSEKKIEKREKEIMNMILNLKKDDGDLLKKWIEIAKENDFSRLTAVNQLLSAARFSLPSKINQPMLVLTSRGDRMVDYNCSKFIAKKYNASLEVHPSAGHELTIDDPAWVEEKILSWLNNDNQ